MSDQDKANPAPDGEELTDQPVDSAQQEQPAAQEQEQEQPQYVTRAELERMQAELIRRVQQSSRDRSQRIEQQIAQLKQAFETKGAPMSPQQEQVLRQTVEQNMDAAEGNVTPSPDVTADIQYIYDEINSTMQESGGLVKPTDPEWKIVQEQLDNPRGSMRQTIAAAVRAAQAKEARLQKIKEKAPARTMSQGGQTSDPNDISGITDSEQLYALGERKLRKGRQ